MSKILILGPERNYQVILTDKESVKKSIDVMHGNLDSDSLIIHLVTTKTISARGCQLYGGSVQFNLAGRIGNLPGDIADFFNQIEGYRSKHNAEYALIQNFSFNTGRTKDELSAVVQLLI